jgi:NitT/TauT family transport system substrate-binding protein
MSGQYVDSLLARGGNSLDEQEMFDLPAPNLADALEAGSLDLAHASEPWLSRLLATGNIELLAGAKDVLPDGQFAVILFGPALIDGDRDIGVRFLEGYLKALRQYNEGKTDRNVEIIAKNTDLDPEFIRTLCWPTIPIDGQINTKSIVDFQKWALGRGLIDREGAVNEFVDEEFLKQAREALGQ